MKTAILAAIALLVFGQRGTASPTRYANNAAGVLDERGATIGGGGVDPFDFLFGSHPYQVGTFGGRPLVNTQLYGGVDLLWDPTTMIDGGAWINGAPSYSDTLERALGFGYFNSRGDFVFPSVGRPTPRQVPLRYAR